MRITFTNRTTTFHEEATDSAVHTYICATFPIETHRNFRRIPTGLCSAHNKSHAHKEEQGSRAPSETKSRKWVRRNYRARGRPCRRRRGWWFLASPSREWPALDVGFRGETKKPEMEILLDRESSICQACVLCCLYGKHLVPNIFQLLPLLFWINATKNSKLTFTPKAL